MRPDSGFEFAGSPRFQVVRRLGGGGMGVVYEAFDRDRNSRVALKTLRTLDATALYRFKNEFRWLQDLHHPNLVTLGELFSDGAQWYYTMELVEGVDFLAWVRSGSEGSGPVEAKGLFNEKRLRSALGQLARALSALHAAQKVHRDIKPTNILVTKNGRVVLLDFGLAKEMSATGHSDSHVVGTVDYMAPEQAASKPVGPEADWYSVGTLLYEAMVGRLPFSGAPLEVLMQKQQRQPKSPKQLEPLIPGDLDDLCSGLLQTDPRKRPRGDDILARLGVPLTEQPPQPSREEAPFVGRQRELDVLAEALDDTRKGEAVTVYVQGESGVGKSALVRQFVEQLTAQDPSTVVLSGRCYERETVPYKAFDGIVDALSRYMTRLPKAEAAALLPLRTSLLAQVFPVLRRVEAVAQTPLGRQETVSPQELRQRTFAALRELLARLAERHMLVLVVDDLQWADADSLALLGEVMRPPDAPPLLLVATVRVGSDSKSSGRGQALNVAAAVTGDVRHILVQRLAPEESRELVRLLLGPRKSEAAAIDAIAREADGHPLFIDELVRHVSSAAQAPAAMRLDEALWARISRLDAGVRELLELVVVAGAPLPQETAAASASLDFGEFGARVSVLRVANLVRTTGARRTDGIEPYHDRVTDAVLSHLGSEAKRRCHERLALALEASGGGGRADPEALSVHWQGAGDSERAAHYAALAAERAANALAFDRAARLYRRAIELRPDEGAQLQAQLAQVLASAGRGGEAALAYLESAKRAPFAESIDLQRRAAEQLLISGHIDAGLSALERVLESFKMPMPKTQSRAIASLLWRRVRARARGTSYKRRDASELPQATLARIDMCWSVGLGLSLVDPVRGTDFQTRALLYALEAGEPFRVCRSLALEAMFAGVGGENPRERQLLRRVEALAKELGHPHALALSALAIGGAAFMHGRWAEARVCLEEAEQVLRERCTGVSWELDTTQLMLLSSLTFLGELRLFSERLPQLLRGARERGDLFASTNFRTAMHPYWLIKDEPERAKAESSAAIKKWSNRGFHAQHYYDMLAQLNARLYLGDVEEAHSALGVQWPELEASQQLRVQIIRVQMWDARARACLALARIRPEGFADRAALIAEARSWAHKLAREDVAWSQAFAQVLEAGAANIEGNTREAIARLEDACRRFEQAEMAMHHHAARRVLGRLSGGDQGQAWEAMADEWMARVRVRNPPRLVATFIPGFPEE